MPITPPLDLTNNLKEKFVAFIDVMGFSNLVYARNVAKLDGYFTDVVDILDQIKNDKVTLQSFLISDAIILIAPTGLQGLRSIVLATRRIQNALIGKKILMRGAISHGEVFYNDKHNIVVGKGFIKAYLLEQEAVYPRVIIDPAVIKVVGEDKNEFIQTIQSPGFDIFNDRLVYQRSDRSLITDDCIFVDYANTIVRGISVEKQLKAVYDTIKENLYSDQKLFSKYVWLRDYFLERLKMNDDDYHRWRNNLSSNKSDVEIRRRQKYNNIVVDWMKAFERL